MLYEGQRLAFVDWLQDEESVKRLPPSWKRGAVAAHSVILRKSWFIGRYPTGLHHAMVRLHLTPRGDPQRSGIWKNTSISSTLGEKFSEPSSCGPLSGVLHSTLGWQGLYYFEECHSATVSPWGLRFKKLRVIIVWLRRSWGCNADSQWYLPLFVFF